MGRDSRKKSPRSGRRVVFTENYPKYISIGRVVAPWGDRGEVKVKVLTDFPERFALLEKVYIGKTARPFQVKGFRFHKGFAILQLEGFHTRSQAEALRGQFIQIPIEEVMPLEEGEYYEFEIIGLEVRTEEGKFLGKVKEIIYTGANDVYVVEGPEGEVLIPAIEDVILDINLAEGRMTVRLMEGLLP
ncbi:MAG: 16S rRNA processing protein RimM [Chloroflexi bacterium]|nr:MAG: 16S rRNA processing protein RimM [Chloroflexota bacterium]HDN79898.1 16S rRNA processing protein RimM [Chloroflexota bacterium]